MLGLFHQANAASNPLRARIGSRGTACLAEPALGIAYCFGIVGVLLRCSENGNASREGEYPICVHTEFARVVAEELDLLAPGLTEPLVGLGHECGERWAVRGLRGPRGEVRYPQCAAGRLKPLGGDEVSKRR